MWSTFAQDNGLLNCPFNIESQFNIDETPLVVQCQSCSTCVLASSFSSHYEECSIKSSNPNHVIIPTALVSTDQIAPTLSSSAAAPANKSKKSAPKAVKKKPPPLQLSLDPDTTLGKKERKKQKTIHKKSIDLDRMCGVKLDGELCTRSLKCKIHSVALKRQVQGRSQLFDALYNERKQFSKEEGDYVAPEDEMALVLYALKVYNPIPLATRRKRASNWSLNSALVDALK